MRVLEIDCSKCNSMVDFMMALRAVLGSPDGHGMSIDAFIDSMIWGGMNRVQPPYEVRVIGIEHAPPIVQDKIRQLAAAIAEGREWKRLNQGIDTEATLQIVEPHSDP